VSAYLNAARGIFQFAIAVTVLGMGDRFRQKLQQGVDYLHPVSSGDNST
jgi:hypothetical protein